MIKDDKCHEEHQNAHIQYLSYVVNPLFVRQNIDENGQKRQEKEG